MLLCTLYGLMPGPHNKFCLLQPLGPEALQRREGVNTKQPAEVLYRPALVIQGVVPVEDLHVQFHYFLACHARKSLRREKRS